MLLERTTELLGPESHSVVGSRDVPWSAPSERRLSAAVSRPRFEILPGTGLQRRPEPAQTSVPPRLPRPWSHGPVQPLPAEKEVLFPRNRESPSWRPLGRWSAETGQWIRLRPGRILFGMSVSEYSVHVSAWFMVLPGGSAGSVDHYLLNTRITSRLIVVMRLCWVFGLGGISLSLPPDSLRWFLFFIYIFTVLLCFTRCVRFGRFKRQNVLLVRECVVMP